MPSRATALLVDLGVDVSSQVSLMRFLYDRSTVMPFSRRITYGEDVGSSDFIDSCFKYSGTGDNAVFNIGDNGIRILLMVTRVGISLCGIDTRVPGGKGSRMGLVLFLNIPQVRPP